MAKSNLKFSALYISYLILILFLPTVQLFAQGRMVRGEAKTEYSIPGTKADFYISPSGNDSWSGKLAEPNPTKTDGPFATIGKAQNAVRELKYQLFKQKKPAIDKRFVGTPHQFGTGRDIGIDPRRGLYTG